MVLFNNRSQMLKNGAFSVVFRISNIYCRGMGEKIKEPFMPRINRLIHLFATSLATSQSLVYHFLQTYRLNQLLVGSFIPTMYFSLINRQWIKFIIVPHQIGIYKLLALSIYSCLSTQPSCVHIWEESTFIGWKQSVKL